MKEAITRSGLGVVGSAGIARTQFVDLPGRLELESGRELRDVRIAYETYGELAPARDNVIFVCHALSGDAHAAGWSAETGAPTALDGVGADERGVRPKGGLGWWDAMIGPGKPFDTDRYFVVSPNLIGGCRGTTGPSSVNPETGRPYAMDFPVVTVADMVRAHRALLDALEIERVLCVTGGSLGGMQALEWAVARPDDIRGCLPIASTAQLDSQGLALNAIARAAIMADPDWQGGAYYGTGREPRAGLGLARMVGHVTYLSKHSLDHKFGRRLQDRDDLSYTLTEADFQVESYLRHQAGRFVERFDANTYLYLSRALTYFDLARHRGTLPDAVAPVSARTLLLSFSSDWIYPTRDSAQLAGALREAGKDVEHVELDTTYGHDSFLLEDGLMAPHISAFLERTHQEVS